MSASDVSVTAEIRRPRLRLVRLRLFARNPGAVISTVFLLAVLLLVIIGPMVINTDPTAFGTALLAPPSLAHPMGTDEYGRDVWIRVIFGGRSSIFVSLIAVAIGGGIGSLLGMIAGYTQGRSDAFLMWLSDILLAFPSLVLSLMVVSILGSGPVSVQVAVGISLIPIFIRVVRSTVLELINQPFVEAARALGCSPGAILARHLFPNLYMPLLVVSTSAIGWAIATGAAVNYLGLGVQVPNPDWGLDLSLAVSYVTVDWWMMFPGIMIMLVILAVNLIGDGMQTSLDPKLRYRT
jgi:peptide/nickel transport system permease protein